MNTEASLDPGADFGSLEYSRAVLNILEDFAEEKSRLHDSQKAVLNILDDLAVEKTRLEKTQADVLRSEHSVRASLKEKEVLLKEIHHRVKNNLQVISSLLNLQARYLADPGVRDVFSDSQNRVLSIALVHEKLYQSQSLSQVEFGDYVTTLLDHLLNTYDATGRGIRKVVDVGGVQLPVDLAIPCGLIVNELVSNSLKYGFPARRKGVVRVSLAEPQPGHLELLVADDGIGLPSESELSQRRSLGLDLVSTFADQIEAKVEVRRGSGTCFRFLFARARDSTGGLR